MDFLNDLIGSPGLVIGLILGAGIGLGVSMLKWGEPNTGLVVTLAIVLGIVGIVVEYSLLSRKK